jgi:hypothetical protein
MVVGHTLLVSIRGNAATVKILKNKTVSANCFLTDPACVLVNISAMFKSVLMYAILTKPVATFSLTK